MDAANRVHNAWRDGVRSSTDRRERRPRYGFVDSRAIAALRLRGSRVVAARLPHKPRSAYPRAVTTTTELRFFWDGKKNEEQCHRPGPWRLNAEGVHVLRSTRDAVESFAIHVEHLRRSTCSITGDPRGA